MRWFKRQLSLLTPEEEHEANISDALLSVYVAFKAAEAEGYQFGPQARLARYALKALKWM